MQQDFRIAVVAGDGARLLEVDRFDRVADGHGIQAALS